MTADKKTPTPEYAVVNIHTYATLDDAYVDHLMGATRPPTARKLAPEEKAVELIVPGDVCAARDLIAADAARRETSKRGGRKPKHVVGMIFQGPPPYGSPEEWPREKVAAWMRDSVDFGIRVLGPESQLICAVLHGDEVRPHCHLAGVAVEDGRVSWHARQRAFLSSYPDLHGSTYARLQTLYHSEVGAKYGLGRGVVRDKAARRERAAPPDRQKAEEHAVDLARRQRAEHEAAADAAERRRQLAHDEAEREERRVAKLRDELEAGKRGVLGAQSERGRELVADVERARFEVREAETRVHRERNRADALESRLKVVERDRDAARADANEAKEIALGFVKSRPEIERAAERRGEERVWDALGRWGRHVADRAEWDRVLGAIVMWWRRGAPEPEPKPETETGNESMSGRPAPAVTLFDTLADAALDPPAAPVLPGVRPTPPRAPTPREPDGLDRP